jgi:cysteine desulfurase family protein
MQNVYLDNAATSFPKAPGISGAMTEYIDKIGSNLNRSSNELAAAAALTTLETRELLCRLFRFQDSSHVVFTPGVTHSLNYILKGFLKPGDHCIVSSMEHNAVVRPLVQLSRQGVIIDRAPCDREGHLLLPQFESLLSPETKLVVMTHASNVSGTILPVQEVGALCRKRGIAFVLDAAQTAGHLDLDFEAMGLSGLCFAGHKGLLGPAGIGGMLLSPELAQSMEPLIAGGTGSVSDSEEMPDFMPDRFEAGTMNIPGIYGLNRALKYILEVTPQAIRKKEMALAAQFMEELRDLPGLRLAGETDLTRRVGVVSLDFLNRDNGETSYQLSERYGILTRCGLHCAPWAHKTLGTFPQGTVRFSFSHFNTEAEAAAAAVAVRSLV